MNETKTEYEALYRKISDLEHEYRSDKKLVKGAVIIFVILFSAFFGITFSQIGKHVDKALSNTAVREAETKATGYLEKAESALKRIEVSEAKQKQILGQINGKELVPIYMCKAGGPYREILKKVTKDEDKKVGKGWTMDDQPYFYVLY